MGLLKWVGFGYGADPWVIRKNGLKKMEEV
jgi:hypothetical protein